VLKTCSFNLWIALVTTAIVPALALPASAQPPLPPEQAATPPPVPPSPGHFQSPQPEYVPGEILVKFKPGTTTPGAQSALRARGLRAMDVSPDDGIMRVQVPPGQEAEAIAALAQREDVEIVSYNHIIYATTDPNDPGYGDQWALAKIDAPGAWNMTTGSGNVIVAIVDSGLDTSHPEFSGRIVYPRDEIENDSQPQDTCEHGTHVTGIIAAQGNNSLGIAGMAWNVKIMPVRALSGSPYSCSGSEADIRDGINWAVSHGAKVINLSLGALPLAGNTCEQQFPVMSQAIANAHAAGVLVVAAAGNDYMNRLACPGLQSDTMAVGATRSDDQRASYSNYGTGLSVVAPGTSVYSTLPVTYGSYGYMTGTSMATPHVTGLAALIWSLSPGLTHDQVRDLIQSTTDDLGLAGWDGEYGYGRINAARALQSAITLQTLPAQVVFLVDDDSGPTPPSKQIQVATNSLDILSWNTSISPNDGWLGIVPPASGKVSVSSAASFSLVATRPSSYGVYTANVSVTGSTPSGGVIGPAIIQVRINYVPDLHQIHMPLISKDSTP
jgi:subtilisin family serine protease